jgi:hypothetical protein
MIIIRMFVRYCAIIDATRQREQRCHAYHEIMPCIFVTLRCYDNYLCACAKNAQETLLRANAKRTFNRIQRA